MYLALDHSSHIPNLQVLRGFLTGRMKGVGDVMHQLEVWGYRLHHVQCPADDYDYSVTNIKEDLR